MLIAEARALKPGDIIWRYGGKFNGSRVVQKWTVKQVVISSDSPDNITLVLKSNVHTEGRVKKDTLEEWSTTKPALLNLGAMRR